MSRSRVTARFSSLSTTVLINHFPLREDLVRLRRIPRFSIWCGTKATQEWHTRFRAQVVVSGHLQPVRVVALRADQPVRAPRVDRLDDLVPEGFELCQTVLGVVAHDCRPLARWDDSATFLQPVAGGYKDERLGRLPL